MDSDSLVSLKVTRDTRDKLKVFSAKKKLTIKECITQLIEREINGANKRE